MSGKYTPLEHYLKNLPPEKREITLSFEQVEKIINDSLPSSAIHHRAWWSNELDGQHVNAHAWLGAGWKVESVNQSQKWVRFIKTK